MEKLVLIDGHSILNRAFYGLPDLTNAKGQHTNAVYGFLNILLRILEEEKPAYLTVAFDVSAPTFRHEIYGAYKGTRKPMPAELKEQVPLLKEVLKAMGVLTVEKPGLEADDILGTLARRGEEKGMIVSLVSGDRDLLQIAGETTCIRIPKTKRGGSEIEDYFAKDVKEKYQVTPTQFIDVKALMGDASDNIPGVTGIGEKTATALIATYGSIENAYAHLEEIKPPKAKAALTAEYDRAVLSKTLATICTTCELEYDWEKARLGDLFTREAYELFVELEFSQLLKRFTPDKKTEEFTGKIHKITDLVKAEEIFARAKEEKQIGFAFLGQESDGNKKKELLGLSLAWSKEESFVFLVQGFLTEAYLSGKFGELAKEDITLLTTELKEQLTWMELKNPLTRPEPVESQGEKRTGNILDLSVAAYLIQPLRGTYDYRELDKTYGEGQAPDRETLTEKKSLGQVLAEKEEAFFRLAHEMATVSWGTWPVLKEKIEEYRLEYLFYEVEMPLIQTLFEMEQEGILVKREALKEYGSHLAQGMERLTGEIFAEAGVTFNLNSPKQLGEVLFEKLQLPYGKKTKTGYSTAADVLEKLAAEYPIVAKILEYRQLSKLKSTYADGLEHFIEEDGRIHTRFHQTITATGRLSSTEPNLQNIPIRMPLGKEIRKVFVPKEGFVFVDADYSQIELRILAHMSEDETLREAYRKAEDIHRLTASQVFHVPLDQVTDLQRRNAKAVNFGIVYGISSFGLSQDLSISRKEAATYMESYFATYPCIQEFLKGLVATGKETGVVTTLYGRRRPMPELASSNFMERSFGERIAMNAPIQGSAADIIKIAMNRVAAALKEQHLRSRLILQVHDELLVEVAVEELDQVKALLKKEMEEAAALSVPLPVEVEVGANWFEAH